MNAKRNCDVSIVKLANSCLPQDTRFYQGLEMGLHLLTNQLLRV